MLVAKQKRKENIAEYILYMFQVEDLIRAFKLNISLIEEKLVSSYNADEKTSIEISDWYGNLISMMEKEQIQEKGHLQFLNNLVNDLNEFHIKLLEIQKDNIYIQLFETIAGLVTELKQKNAEAKNDVDLGLEAIYGFLLLKMQKKSISNETTDAIKSLSTWLGNLSKLYKEYEDGKIDL